MTAKTLQARRFKLEDVSSFFEAAANHRVADISEALLLAFLIQTIPNNPTCEEVVRRGMRHLNTRNDLSFAKTSNAMH
jgi:hypothetical protein